MTFRLSNPLRIHYGPKGTTRLDDIGHCFSVTRTGEDGKAVISRSSMSRFQADRTFDELAGLQPAPEPWRGSWLDGRAPSRGRK